MMWRLMDEIYHRTKIKLQCQSFLNGDAVFVCFFFFCVVTVLTVPQYPPLTGTWHVPQIQNDRIYSPEGASIINK